MNRRTIDYLCAFVLLVMAGFLGATVWKRLSVQPKQGVIEYSAARHSGFSSRRGYVPTSLVSSGELRCANLMWFDLDMEASYAVNKHVSVFLIGENLTDKRYLGSFFAGGQLAAPFQLFGGVRLALF
jgi:hypothetical protein